MTCTMICIDRTKADAQRKHNFMSGWKPPAERSRGHTETGLLFERSERGVDIKAILDGRQLKASFSLMTQSSMSQRYTCIPVTLVQCLYPDSCSIVLYSRHIPTTNSQYGKYLLAISTKMLPTCVLKIAVGMDNVHNATTIT